MLQLVAVGSRKRVAQTFVSFCHHPHSCETRVISLSACVELASFYASWSAEEGRHDGKYPTRKER